MGTVMGVAELAEQDSPISDQDAASIEGGIRALVRRNRLAVAGGAVVILLCVIAIFADVIAPQSYTKANFGHLYESPNREFPLGTDQLGRDVLSRLIYGARVSMLVGLGAQVIIVLIGVPIGALSGYVGGRTDLLLTRFVDVMYAFPRLLFRGNPCVPYCFHMPFSFPLLSYNVYTMS